MKHSVTLMAAVATLTLSQATASGADSASAGRLLQGTAVAYASGTAFAILDAGKKLQRVKLTGVDAPERRQRFAAEARNLASVWLGRGPLDISIDGRGKDTTRLHGRVHIDGRDLGLVLIEAGLAWCDPSDESMLPATLRAKYRTACTQAKGNRQGLWQDANPMPPWEYRKLPEFDPPPQQKQGAGRSCRDVGHQSVQCDDGTRYRSVGDDIYGSDGSIYVRRGRTLTDQDGNRYTRQGSSTYGTDGTVCRSRGRQTHCY